MLCILFSMYHVAICFVLYTHALSDKTPLQLHGQHQQVTSRHGSEGRMMASNRKHAATQLCASKKGAICMKIDSISFRTDKSFRLASLSTMMQKRQRMTEMPPTLLLWLELAHTLKQFLKKLFLQWDEVFFPGKKVLFPGKQNSCPKCTQSTHKKKSQNWFDLKQTATRRTVSGI